MMMLTMLTTPPVLVRVTQMSKTGQTVQGDKGGWQGLTPAHFSPQRKQYLWATRVHISA